MSRREDPVAHLEQLLAEPRAVEPPPIDVARIAPLLGLGLGLTPSGDDYLGGLLVALSPVGRSGVQDHLWQAFASGSRLTATTAISRAHLAAAAEGLGSAALHHALGAILKRGHREDRCGLRGAGQSGPHLRLGRARRRAGPAGGAAGNLSLLWSAGIGAALAVPGLAAAAWAASCRGKNFEWSPSGTQVDQVGPRSGTQVEPNWNGHHQRTV